jgi:hypothetical protein
MPALTTVEQPVPGPVLRKLVAGQAPSGGMRPTICSQFA